MPSSGKNISSDKSKSARSIFAKLVSIFLKLCSWKHKWKRTKS